MVARLGISLLLLLHILFPSCNIDFRLLLKVLDLPTIFKKKIKFLYEQLHAEALSKIKN